MPRYRFDENYDDRFTLSLSSWSLAVPSRRRRSSQPLQITDTPFSMNRDLRYTCTAIRASTFELLTADRIGSIIKLTLQLFVRDCRLLREETYNRKGLQPWGKSHLLYPMGWAWEMPMRPNQNPNAALTPAQQVASNKLSGRATCCGQQATCCAQQVACCPQHVACCSAT